MKKTPYCVICTLGTLFLLIVANHVVYAQSITQGLVAYYPFEGNTNDYSGKGNNGTIAGGVTFVAGQVGQAASFDGTTGSISVPDNVSLQLSTFTLAAWVFPTSIAGGNRIVEKGNSNSYWLDVNPSGQVLVGFYDGAYHDLLGPVLAINTWHFVAGTYDGSVLRLYVDGVLVNSAALISTPAQTAEPLVIGWKFGGIVSDYFAGRIDELQIYNRALSPAELQPTPCHLYTSSYHPVPFTSGFGVPWNVFNDTQLLLKASCTDSSLTAYVGTNQNEAIFNQGYQWDGTKWNQFSFTCTGQASDSWCIGTAQAKLPINIPFYLAYVCYLNNNQYYCGCRDTQTCSPNTQGLWQLQGITGMLSFPLQNGISTNPYNAVINSVVDHSMTLSYSADNKVFAYTGEKGDRNPSQVPNTSFFAFQNETGTPFMVNGNYKGGDDRRYLSYDGHPGYDYSTAGQNLVVYAAADGKTAQTDPSCPWMVVIDHLNGYKTVYLHLQEMHPSVTDSSGRYVTGKDVFAGMSIGTVGDRNCSGAAHAFPTHLHFEVRKTVNGIDIPVDPYGWEGLLAGNGSDRYRPDIPNLNRNLWAPRRPVAWIWYQLPPASVKSGSSFAVSWSVVGNSSQTDIHFDIIEDLSDSTCRSRPSCQITNIQSGGGIFNGTITAPLVNASKEYYLAAHAIIDNLDYYSPIFLIQVAP